MRASRRRRTARRRGVLLGTAPGAGAEGPFVHALALALVQETRLTILGVSASDGPFRWEELPGVRARLAQWGVLGAERRSGAPAAPPALGVRKAVARHSTVLPALLERLALEPADLVVLGREAVGRCLEENPPPAARGRGAPVLVVPEGEGGFVSPRDGRVTLRRILVPVGDGSLPRDLFEIVERAALWFSEDPVEARVVSLGRRPREVRLSLPTGPRCAWSCALGSLGGLEGVLAAARVWGADLVAFAEAGREPLSALARNRALQRLAGELGCSLLLAPGATRAPAARWGSLPPSTAAPGPLG